MLNRWYKILRKVEAASQLRISIGKTHSRGVCQRELGKDNDTIGDKHRKQNTTSEGPLYVLRDALVVVRQRPSHKLSGDSRATETAARGVLRLENGRLLARRPSGRLSQSALPGARAFCEGILKAAHKGRR